MRVKIETVTFNIEEQRTEESYVTKMLETHQMLWRQGGLYHTSDGGVWTCTYCWAEKPTRYPIAFHTVDVACVRDGSVVMIQKKSELGSGLWRFPGGFMDPGETAESAAARELWEETHVSVKDSDMRYIGSFVIDDPRYRGTPDGITTSMFAVICPKGVSPSAGDDAAAIAMIPVNDIVGVCNPIHKHLAEKLLKWISNDY